MTDGDCFPQQYQNIYWGINLRTTFHQKRNSKGSTSISQTPENKIAMDEDEEHSIVGCAIENTPGCAIENTPENKIAMDEDEEHSIVGCAIENTPENKIAMSAESTTLQRHILGCKSSEFYRFTIPQKCI
ncbi:hypothetical protein OUZ56_022289 [Daphnia magna]|uniref:Uncharacterized protein n=1 Tax=Daphnia magna TaxID=35525 RepID=A0ABR0AWH6_9CRUS|nr:hypothetical protein OUZ56_022289 [Daphnia magna]